jgi:uncharacterized protein (TIGR02246 family)
MSDEAAIRQVIETWLAATRKGDLSTILTLMTDDVVFMIPGQEPFGKDGFIAAFKTIADAQAEATSDIVELKIFGDWAYIRNHLDLKIASPDGGQAHRAGYTLTLLRKEADGQWRLARDANLLTAVV